MGNMGNMDLTKLVEYSEIKLIKLKEMKQLTQAQMEAIEKRDIDTLNNLVEKKQKIIEYIDSCDMSFHNELKQLKEQMGVKSLSDIKGTTDKNKDKEILVGVVIKIIDTIQQIQVMEKENYNKILANMKQVMGKLKNVRQGKKGFNAYNPKINTVSGSFIDKKK